MTELHLLNVPFEANYKDTVWFPNTDSGKQAQYDYMMGKRVPGMSFTDFSYQRKDGVIRLPIHIDKLYKCNYVMYKNNNISDSKWFYAFIIDMKYISEERTDVTIQTDVMQTWLFDFTVKDSFVEREHVDDDTRGIHTVPEQLETGEYVCDYSTSKKSLKGMSGIIVGSTIDLNATITENESVNVSGMYYGGVYSGIKYYYFASGIYGTPGAIDTVLKKVAEAGKSDAIVSMFLAPRTLIKTTAVDGGAMVLDESFESYVKHWNEYLGENEADTLPEIPTSLNGYTPRNNKLLTHPFCYLLASNNSGGANTYKYEFFKNGVDFDIYSSITPGMSVRLIPLNYGGVELNNSEGLNLGKFPVCAWNTDVYTNWLTQNSVNVGLGIVTGATQVVAGAVMLGGTGGMGGLLGTGSIAGGFTTIANTLASVNQHSFVPPAVEGNVNSGDVTYSSGLLTFTLYQMNIKKEYAQIIDEFFDMFGYKVGRVKTPNTDHRERYWYTKTVDVNIDGAIPNKDLDTIKQCYDKGITFWRHTEEMGRYPYLGVSYSNNIVPRSEI